MTLDPQQIPSPASLETTGTAPAASQRRGAAQLLFGWSRDPRTDHRRIAVGLLVLAAAGIAVLNVGIYQNSRTRELAAKWDLFTSNADDKVFDVRQLLTKTLSQARFVAADPVFRRAALVAKGTRGDVDRGAAAATLDRAARVLEFDSIELLTSSGESLARTGGDPNAGSDRDRWLVERALHSPTPVTAFEPIPGREGTRLAIAIPVVRDPVQSLEVAMVFKADVNRLVRELLTGWPGFGPRATAYLVAREGEDVLYVSDTPGEASPAGARRPLATAPKPAALAAQGSESTLEVLDAPGGALWTATRNLPEFGCGLVAQVDRKTMHLGLRGMVIGLLLLDLAMIVLAIAAIWFWRRQYATGLADQQFEISKRHAERMQAIFDTAFDAILTLDRSGRVRTANRAAERLTGRTAAEMEGQPAQRFLRFEAPPGGEETIPTGRMSYTEVLRSDDQRIPVEVSMGVAGTGDEVLHTLILRDIGDRIAAEKQIRSSAMRLETTNRRLEELNAQLEEASRLKSEFLANTSHELRTPLNGMIGFLQLVLDGMCDSPEEERDFLKQALACSRHLLGLINDVLDIAKIEAGKLAVQVERVDVMALFEEVYTVTHVQAAQRGLELSFVPPAAGGLGARGDFGKIKQVIINLVGNSLKFTPSGRITVRAAEHADLGHVLFEVIDTGIGIPAERQAVIFDKFAQGDGTTTRKYGGTGLGLAISRSLVELMGGVIGVQSEGEGKGTRMWFSIPLWRAEGEEVVESAPSDQIAGPTGGPLVLLVEDDGVFRCFLTALLHHHGYRTVEAANAEGGWMLARRLRPSVVVLDYALTCAEGANLRTGWDLAERMTADPKTRHIPLIFLTGFDLELREKLKATAFARNPTHLAKPIDGAVLVRKIEELVGSDGNRVVRVLMADDDASVAAYLRKVLPEERFHVEVATDGEQCLHILRTQPQGFDLLLLDLMMPEVSGYDVLREMTLTGVGSHLPVLVLTNYPEARDEEEKRLLEQGLVLDVISKSTVHDNPLVLPHIIDWHLQVAVEYHQAAGAGEGAVIGGPSTLSLGADAADERRKAA